MLTSARRMLARRLQPDVPAAAPAPAPAAQPYHGSILTNPFIAGKVLSAQDERGYIVDAAEDPDPTPERSVIDGLPIPPTKELRLWYGTSPEHYVETGKQDIERMLGILAEGGVAADRLLHVLELGCGAGRMLRHVPRQPGRSEHWGVDINAKCIMWAQRYLMPPMSFAITTTAPHLPFPDATFDLVFAGSVFTHIADLADAWFLEVRRVLRPGGHAYLTVHDENTVGYLMSDEAASNPWQKSVHEMMRRFEHDTGVVSRGYRAFCIASNAIDQVQIFYDQQTLVRKWGAWMTPVSQTPWAYGQQTALVFRR